MIKYILLGLGAMTLLGIFKGPESAAGTVLDQGEESRLRAERKKAMAKRIQELSLKANTFRITSAERRELAELQAAIKLV